MDTKALRQKILDLAIRGKLVPQDPNDEPASVLLERIRAEKQQMVKDGKLKPKDIKNDTIIFVGEDNLHYEKFQDGTVKFIEDEIPFDVPEGWEWTRLGFLGQYKKGPFGSSITKAMFIPDSPTAIKIYEQKNAICKDASLGNYFISKDKYETLKGFEVFPNDIIVSCAGTIGESYVLPSNMRKGIINQALMKITLFDLRLLDFYLMYFDFKLKESAQEHGHGIALKNIPPFDVLKQYLIPIPPIEEQKKIIKSINSLLDMVDLIDSNSNEVAKLINFTKSKILDLAIRGKLVPQDPNDESASVLLERIRAEKEELIKAGKIKRDKKESIIFKGEDNSYYEKMRDKVRCIDAEIPFDLPELWTFARLKHIGGIVGGGTPKTNISKYWDGNIPWLTPADFSGYDSMYISTGSRTITDFGLKSSSAQMLPANSILYSSRAPIGYTAIATNPVCTNQGFKSVVPYDFSMSPYLYYCLKARTDNIIQRATGTTFKEISGSEMAETIIPIPPINEQSRIVEKVTQLQEVISFIEKSLS